MVPLTIFLVSFVACAYSAVLLPGAQTLPGYETQGLATGNAHSGPIASFPLSVVATSDDQSDDQKPAIVVVKELVADVADRVSDVIGNVRDKVGDLVDKAKDALSDAGNTKPIETTGGSSADASNNPSSNSTETANEDDDSDEEDGAENEGSKEETTAPKSVTKCHNNGGQGQNDGAVNGETGQSSGECLEDKTAKDSNKKDGSGEINGNLNNQVNGTNNKTDDVSGSAEIVTGNGKDNLSSRDQDETNDVWYLLKKLTGDQKDDSEDDDTKLKRYLTQMSKVRGYLDAIDSSLAANEAKQSGTCPIYPVQVGHNRVTITTQNGCKIIIKLKGTSIDKIENGHEEKKKEDKKSITVSYKKEH